MKEMDEMEKKHAGFQAGKQKKEPCARGNEKQCSCSQVFMRTGRGGKKQF